MKHFLRNNGLSVVILLLFLIFLAGQALTGYWHQQFEQKLHGRSAIDFLSYLSSSHFWEAVFENWESEFLQMSAYVFLTVFLYQKGSAESKDPDAQEKVDEDPRLHSEDPLVPGPVRRGGWELKLYQHSLSLTLFGLFLISFVGHIWSGAAEYNNDLIEHGASAVSILEYVRRPRFWFESFQNWQSEFLAVASIVIFSIWLREQGSPESKPVAARHGDTGS